ncbi:MAG TPA: DUF2867 domain-containing protein [Burkholderiaceae bacterium]
MTSSPTPRVRACGVPAGSAIAQLLPGADFHDAYEVVVDHPERTALEHLLVALAATPPWVDRAMRLRNRVVARFGLKRLGDLGLAGARGAPAPERPGDRVGIFMLRSRSDDEVLVEDDDRHLRVVLSVRRLAAGESQPARIVLTTVVHLHNLLGRLYMLPVAPMHRLIAPAVLRRVNDGASTP